MSINAWNNWVEIDVHSDLTFDLNVIAIVGVASIQFHDEKNFVVDSFEGTVHNMSNGDESVVLLNYRDNFNDPLFNRIREHIKNNFWPLIQEAIREQLRSTKTPRPERHADKG